MVKFGLPSFFAFNFYSEKYYVWWNKPVPKRQTSWVSPDLWYYTDYKRCNVYDETGNLRFDC